MKKFLDRIELYVAAACLVLMLAIDFMNVLGRFVFNTSWAFTEELVCGLFILVTLSGAAAGVRTDAHIGLSLLTDRLPKRLQKYVVCLQCLAVAAFSLVLLWYGIAMVQSELRNHITTAALGWPEAVFGSFVPIGAAFLTVRSVQRACLALLPKRKEAGE